MNCIIVHGSPDNESEMDTFNKHWIPWTIKTLKEKEIKTSLPSMPDPMEPIYEDWKKTFEENEIDENTILIGHSSGTTFLVKWLGETKRKVKKLILVAPWKPAWRETKQNEEFCDFEIDSSIKERIKAITYFTSNDEDKEGKESLKIFHKALGGEIIDLPEHGHYVLEDMGTEEFPELIKEVLET